MKNSLYFMLVAFVLIAPNLTNKVRLVLAIIAFAVALLFMNGVL